MQIMTYKPIMMNIKRNINDEMMNNGLRPNSSLSDAVTRGTTPNASVKRLRPATACRYEQLSSGIMDGNPKGYVDETEARGATASHLVEPQRCQPTYLL